MPSITVQQALDKREDLKKYRAIIDNPKANIDSIGYKASVRQEARAQEGLHRAYDRMTDNEKAELEAILSA